jgi:hypothetical protein
VGKDAPGTQNTALSRERPKYSKPQKPVKNYFQPTDNPVDTRLGPRLKAYFSAIKRADRRDLYRDAVFSCSMPFLVALSSVETVSRYT